MVVCIGGGPAGLTAAYLLSKRGVPCAVLEQDPEYLGGIARTVRYKGFRFDIGGHRFFSKSQEVEDLWTEILGDDLLDRPRSSRIYYRGKFFAYPLKAADALLKLGLVESALCVLSYAWAKVRPIRQPANFEQWVSNQFGRRLFRIFFKTYTEKVWGMPCDRISADWAAQRIKGLSLGKAILHSLFPPRREPGDDRSRVIKTLIDTFRYPRKGPGMMWERAAERIRERGGRVVMGARVTGVERLPDGRGYRVRFEAGGATSVIEAEHVVSSAPIRELVASLSPEPPREAAEAARGLGYRDFIVVALVSRANDVFTDNWVYIHDPGVKVGRIQNFRSWSPEMVPEAGHACYGLEYFCFEGDGLWTAADSELIDLARREMVQLGLARPDEIVDGCVVRQRKAYPVYDEGYSHRVDAVRDALARGYPGLHLVGRNGMHKYNNQDHAMMTAMLTVENIVRGRPEYDVWKVNQDAEYHEEGEAGGERSTVPRPVNEPRPRRT